ncbi:MAG: 3-phosphoshikimate 1-carboxyvinyltransferase [Acidimicrobiia bacterium]
MSRLVVSPPGHPVALPGPIRVPGDKSIAHRAFLLAARATAPSTIAGVPAGLDVAATRGCIEALGAGIDSDGRARVVVEPAPVPDAGAPEHHLDCANSGTTMRLLCGILAGRPGAAVLDGDASLRHRPMRRVTAPLGEMGAHIATTDGHAPLRVTGAELGGIDYACPVPSAQVKGAILLAGLDATTPTRVTLPGPSRDHTERMLAALGVGVSVEDGGRSVGVAPAALPGFDAVVPGDVSSAAFVAGLAAVTGGAVRIEGVGLNPTRTRFLEVLARMGCAVETEVATEALGEPIGAIEVTGPATAGFVLEGDAVADCIDEIPLLCAVAACVEAESVVRDAAELRVKESDRLATTAAGLRALGAGVEESSDALAIVGRAGPRRRPRPVNVDAAGDHRIALALAVAGCALGPVAIDGWQAAAVSYAEFAEVLAAAGALVDREP